MNEHIPTALPEHSIRLITELQTPEGAYPASPTFSAYAGYCWFRDGSFIADAISAAGQVESADRFFTWCADVLRRRAGHIRWLVSETEDGRAPSGSEMLPARYTFDGRDGTDEWWDFQLDGYGTWLWALAEHLRRHQRDGIVWREAVDLTVDYLCAFWQRPCYDWWEEHRHHVHVSTLACIAAGLEAASSASLASDERVLKARTAATSIRTLVAERGAHDGHLAKWLGSTAVDGSLAAALAPLGFTDPASALGKATLDVLDRHLTVDGGTHRYLGDTFYGGGQWPLLSCFLGLAHLASGNRRRAVELYDWAAGTATESLDLPEQVGDHLIAPAMRHEWVARWGAVATPLLWSHAMLLRLAVELDPPNDAAARPLSEEEGATR